MSDIRQLKMNEHQEQSVFVEDILWRYKTRPDFIRLLFFATLNGAWLAGKSYAAWAKHEKEGAVKGVSDILYLQPRGGYAYLVIEMKAKDRKKEKDGGVSEDQLAWLHSARTANAFVAVCYGAEEAIAVFDRYMDYEK